MIDIERISRGLHLEGDGIWYAYRASEVSYPADGSQMCLEVEDESFWFKHRNDCLIEAVRRFPPAGPIFDVGGGNGHVAAALIRSGFETVLIEPSPQGSRAAKTRRQIPQVICATLEEAKFLPGSLGAVGMFDVLEHIEDDQGLLKRLSGILQPSGRLYISVPAYRLLWSDVDSAAGHHRRYSLRTLRRRLTQVGFEIDYMTYFFRLLPIPVLLLRTLPSLLGRRRQRTVERMKSAHLAERSFLKRLAQVVLAREMKRIRRGGRMRFGGSCLVVASASGSVP